MATPIEHLVAQHLPLETGLLTQEGCYLVADSEHRRDVLARVGAAPDNLAGERVLAVFTDGIGADEKRTRLPFGACGLFTDRRMVGLAEDDRGQLLRFDFDYARLEGASIQTKMFVPRLTVHHAGRATQPYLGGLCKNAAAFINAVVQLPPEQRSGAPVGLPGASADDPTGAAAARAGLWAADSRTELLLAHLSRLCSTGGAPVQVCADLVGRVVLQHRNEVNGRASRDGAWLSPLGKDDLSNLCIALFGNPVQHVEHPNRALTFDYRNGLEKLQSVGRGLGLAMDVASLDVVSLLTRDKGPSRHLTVLIDDVEYEGRTFARFRLHQGDALLCQTLPAIATRVHAGLDRLEAALLLRRCVYGWSAAAPQLLSTPSSHLVEQMTATSGPFDARALGRPQDQGGQGIWQGVVGDAMVDLAVGAVL